MTWAERLKRLREGGMSLDTLSRALGCTSRSIWGWEHGGTPSYRWQKKILDLEQRWGVGEHGKDAG